MRNKESEVKKKRKNKLWKIVCRKSEKKKEKTRSKKGKGEKKSRKRGKVVVAGKNTKKGDDISVL